MKRYFILDASVAIVGVGPYLWWKPNRAGYTHDLRLAGQYTEQEIVNLPRVSDIPVPVERAFTLSTLAVVNSYVGLGDLKNHRPDSSYDGAAVRLATMMHRALMALPGSARVKFFDNLKICKWCGCDESKLPRESCYCS